MVIYYYFFFLKGIIKTRHVLEIIFPVLLLFCCLFTCLRREISSSMDRAFFFSCLVMASENEVMSESS